MCQTCQYSNTSTANAQNRDPFTVACLVFIYGAIMYLHVIVI